MAPAFTLRSARPLRFWLLSSTPVFVIAGMAGRGWRFDLCHQKGNS
jgi:hypothetical protein